MSEEKPGGPVFALLVCRGGEELKKVGRELKSRGLKVFSLKGKNVNGA